MRGLPTILSVIAILMAPTSTRPEIVGFDDVASGTYANSLDLPGLAIASGVVLSETDAALLTGFDASDWASSGTNGLVNADEPIFEFFFDVPVGPVSVEVRLVPGHVLGIGIAGVLADEPGPLPLLTGLFLPPDLQPPLSERTTNLRLGDDGARFASVQVFASDGSSCEPTCTPDSSTATLFSMISISCRCPRPERVQQCWSRRPRWRACAQRGGIVAALAPTARPGTSRSSRCRRPAVPAGPCG